MIFSSQLAIADILMLDFNGNNSTIAAAREAAKLRGEKVIVIPKHGKKLKQISFKNEIARLKKNGTSVSSIIFSGHDGGGHFSGKNGNMSKSDVKNVMSQFPEMAKGVDSLILRGCYTATPGEAMALENDSWNGIFPELKMIAGYIGSAPSSEKDFSKSFIEEILNLESKIYMESSAKNVEKMFENISYSEKTTNSIAYRSCNNNEYRYIARNLQNKGVGAMSQDEIKKMCNKKEINSQLSIVNKYYDAVEKGYRNPPKEHHNTPLREAYTYLNSILHCKDIIDIHFYPTLQQIIKLIYFDYIKSNFNYHYGDKLIKANKAIKKYNLENDPDLKTIDINTASRAQIKEFIHSLHSIVPADILDKDKYTYSYEHKDDDDFKAIIQIREIASQTLDDLIPTAVPFDWVSSKKSSEKGDVWIPKDVRLNYGLEKGTSVDDLKYGHYQDAVSFYLKNHNNQKLKKEVKALIFQKMNQSTRTGSDKLARDKAKSFISDQVEESPIEVMKTAIRNPQFVNKDVFDKMVINLKKINYKLTEKDYNYFQSSYITKLLYSLESKKQNNYYKKIFESFSSKKDKNLKDIFNYSEAEINDLKKAENRESSERSHSGGGTTNGYADGYNSGSRE
jgi:hypothetical protein